MTGSGQGNTAHEQQVAAGKEMVGEIMEELDNELHQPGINDLKFELTDKDFDYRRISLIDSTAYRIVAKIEINDLEDSPANAAIRKKLKTQLRRAIESFYTSPK